MKKRRRKRKIRPVRGFTTEEFMERFYDYLSISVFGYVRRKGKTK